jgi:hypothetical protein
MRASLKIAALVVSACFIIPWGCAGKKHPKEIDMQKDTITASLDSSFQLMHNQTAYMESEDLSIKFLNVIEDSRCPVGVICIWPGQVKIELEIRQKGKEPEKIVLTSQAGRDELAETRVNDFLFRLLKVEPLRQKDAELQLSDYVIMIMVSMIEGTAGSSSQ